MPYLLIINGPGTGKRFELTHDAATIGRHSDCEVALTEAESVSRHHARIVREGDNFFVVDLGSRNGTFVSGVRVEHCRLQDNDRLAISDVVLVFKSAVSDGGPTTESSSATAILDASRKTVDGFGLGMVAGRGRLGNGAAFDRDLQGRNPQHRWRAAD